VWQYMHQGPLVKTQGARITKDAWISVLVLGNGPGSNKAKESIQDLAKCNEVFGGGVQQLRTFRSAPIDQAPCAGDLREVK
jgi:hypothetical protein